MTFPLDINKFRITARYDSFNKQFWGYNGGWHRALDIAAPEGTPFVACADGVVIESQKLKDGANTIQVRHDKDNHISVYHHNQVNLVKVGDRVKAGQVIGRIGKTGFVTGPHIHFAILTPDKRNLLDPEKYIVQNTMNNKKIIVQNGWGISHVAREAGYSDYADESRWNYLARLNGHATHNTFRLFPGMEVVVEENSPKTETPIQIVNNLEEEKKKLEEAFKNQISKLEEEKKSLQDALSKAQSLSVDTNVIKQEQTPIQADNSPKIDLSKLQLESWQNEAILTGIADFKSDPAWVSIVTGKQCLS